MLTLRPRDITEYRKENTENRKQSVKIQKNICHQAFTQSIQSTSSGGHAPHQHSHSAGQPTASAQECAKDHCHHCHHLVYSCSAGTSDLGELQPAHPSGSGRPARRHQGAPQQEQGGRLTPAGLPGPEIQKYRNTFAIKLLHKAYQ